MATGWKISFAWRGAMVFPYDLKSAHRSIVPRERVTTKASSP